MLVVPAWFQVKVVPRQGSGLVGPLPVAGSALGVGRSALAGPRATGPSAGAACPSAEPSRAPARPAAAQVAQPRAWAEVRSNERVPAGRSGPRVPRGVPGAPWSRAAQERPGELPGALGSTGAAGGTAGGGAGGGAGWAAAIAAVPGCRRQRARQSPFGTSCPLRPLQHRAPPLAERRAPKPWVRATNLTRTHPSQRRARPTCRFRTCAVWSRTCQQATCFSSGPDYAAGPVMGLTRAVRCELDEACAKARP